jgi:hypothetical protein
MQGLRIFEERFKKYGIAVSSESLVFAFNLCLITGMEWEEDLSNCANAVETPSQGHMKRARDSSLKLLALAKQHLDAGLGIPYPLWRRLASRLVIPEILGGVLSIVAVLISILLLLMGSR